MNTPVTASDSATRRKEKDNTGSSLGLKNSSTDALKVCLNLPNPGTSILARLMLCGVRCSVVRGGLVCFVVLCCVVWCLFNN